MENNNHPQSFHKGQSKNKEIKDKKEVFAVCQDKDTGLIEVLPIHIARENKFGQSHILRQGHKTHMERYARKVRTNIQFTQKYLYR